MSENKMDVTDLDLGVWVAGSTLYNPVEFSVRIVDLAIEYGLEIEPAWEQDKPTFLSGDAPFEMIEDLGYVTDVALEYLNDMLPEGYFFEFDDGLVLMKDTDEDDDL